MKAILIIAHHCILPGAYKGFEEILDRLHHDLPGTRVASTSLLDLENDLRTLLREDVESVTLLPYLLLNGQHTKNDVPRVVAKLQAEFPQIPITLLPCLGDWKEFSSMVVAGVRSAQNACTCAPLSSWSHECGDRIHSERAHSSNLFSIELNLEGRNVLVVGGGRIALRKVKTLIPTGAHITVVAPQFDPEFEMLKADEPSSITLKQRPYEPLDLRCVFMVFICTDQPAVNAQVSNDARARRILVNNACDYLDGDFIVPARMDFGENIAVTVSTQGRAPSLAKKLKQKIQTEWAEDLVQIEKDFKKE
ncbi:MULTISPECIES: NAD(P)-dependent oxidoreductase [unclassified Fibrobacter]|uniref:NAD(P)-dependent oxidoreductase n=1 Tax=unclassified Fibrobacter TaxID=2634177 RepID=UPI0009168745|nr:MULTISPECIES: NAD(P)-dependent oxidoreductase [unclassified Fibrobacter]SHM52213.1 precorrin-2 dehydrogenase / sirohydrochlorin ferrochelatase [Fibrobacter sp. UWB7]SMG11621.1 precorrin-2 dehydrogenase / sirohydrochlorin ferrochelatase [Fibrobacter sp. UWB13]